MKTISHCSFLNFLRKGVDDHLLNISLHIEYWLLQTDDIYDISIALFLSLSNGLKMKDKERAVST